jgi:hypothetical protein
MNMRTNLLTLSAFFLFLGMSFAQSEVTLTPKGGAVMEKVLTDSWTYFVDEDSQTYYIDFETINVNLSDVIVRDAQGMEVLRDDVLDLPVNTIYELDFSRLASGTYTIELRSFSGVLRKEVNVP